MQNCSPIGTPMAIRVTPTRTNNNLVNATEFRALVGSLQYLTFTCPDITHVVNRVCQYFQTPTTANLRDVKRIIRYLQGTVHLGIRYLAQSSPTLYAFSDSDWAGCPLTSRSTTGYCVYLGANCISWSTKKQTTVARSSAESEYRSLASIAAELTWISFLLRDIGISLSCTPLLLCDNKSAFQMSKNPVSHARTRHIELDFHFIQEKISHGLLSTRYVPATPLELVNFREFFAALGVENVIAKTVTFRGTQDGVRAKTWAKPSNGFIKYVLFQHVVMVNVENPIIIVQKYCPDFPDQVPGVKISHITYLDMHGSSSTEIAMKFDCSKQYPGSDITLEDVDLQQRTGSVVIH